MCFHRLARKSPSGRNLLQAASFTRRHLVVFPETTSQLTRRSSDHHGNIDFEHLFRSCTTTDHVKRLHALIFVYGKAQDEFLSTRLLNHYAHLGDVSLSLTMFNQIPCKDTRVWNSMVSAYVRNGRLSQAAECFSQFMLTSGLRPDKYTFPPVIKACRDVPVGRKLHCFVQKMGFERDVFVAASLVHMYTRFGLLDLARKVFDEMPTRDVVSWNAMISGYCQNGDAEKALCVLDSMRLEGLKMDPVTVCCLLSACAKSDYFVSGMSIHLYVVKHGFNSVLFVNNALVKMYAEFGYLQSAQKIFDEMEVRDVVSWNSIIDAYEKNHDPATAFTFITKMQAAGIKLDMFTLVSLASIIAEISNYRTGKSVHGFILRRCLMMGSLSLGNALVDMYAKLGHMDYAHQVFEGLPIKDVVSWNTLISGYAQMGLGNEAIEVYQTMEECKEVTPNQGTFVGILTACSSAEAVRQGMKIHGLVIKNSLCFDVFVGTCLIDMYGKCGRIEDALSLFYQVPLDTSIPWNAIISCHGIHGHGGEALDLFHKMLKEGVEPDSVTFISLLSACSHAGMVKEGERCFQEMNQNFNISPGLRHFGCMVDMYGRAGLLKKAFDFIKNMPMNPDATIWGALLSACKIHGNVELGELASEQLFKADPEHVGYHVLLSNIYANKGKWEEMGEVRSSARDRGLKKTPGWSSIEVNGNVDVFYTGNRSHPRCEEIYDELRNLTAKIRNRGYVPDYRDVLQDVEDDEKDDILMRHNERLAIAFGIISTAPGTTLHVFKNLRVCGDCHNVTKLISLVTEREIIVRDSNRFHHFKDGTCSCGDYW